MSFGVINSAAGRHSAGTKLNRMLDKLGLPDKVGDLMGAALDARMGNVAGMRRNLFDAFNKVTTRQMDFRAKLGIPSFGRVPSPFAQLRMLQGSPFLGAFAGPGALSLLSSTGAMGVAAGFLERALGGTGGTGGAAGGIGGGVGSRGGSDTKSILNDPSLSFEEKMAMLLMTLAEKQEKEIEAHMAKMDRGGKGGGGGLDIGGAIQGAIGGFLTGGKIGAVLGAAGSLLGGAGGSKKGKQSEQRMAAELQMMQEKLSRLYQTLSNVMKSFHQSASNAIRNIN